jgi:hypothetical protein
LIHHERALGSESLPHLLDPGTVLFYKPRDA